MVLGRSHSIASTPALLLNRGSEPGWQTAIDEHRPLAGKRPFWKSQPKAELADEKKRPQAVSGPLFNKTNALLLFNNEIYGTCLIDSEIGIGGDSTDGIDAWSSEHLRLQIEVPMITREYEQV